ncbi:glutamine synthetase family protein [Thalassococcus sp. S3]|uniref:glutamine synthetase family protein n=1 Tax=Thalassococcus sp. S3 TaxID=2017482 RepID=UPI001024075E|nr:glutamine synthetase family protein [Thalassococcus sp. S3]QBF32772.1 glutamine synthetase [Thalassococcus sp. S3]
MDLSQYQTVRVAACDLNGQMRGKRLPARLADKVTEGTLRMPLSVLNVDLWGADIEGSPLVFESGDADGILKPTDRGPVPMPWLSAPSALIPMEMFCENGAAFDGDPRHALARVLRKYKALGWTVLAATEMEFTLVDDRDDTLVPPANPRHGRALQGEAILSLAQLDAFDVFFSAIYSGCDEMGIPMQSAISESGVGQFEITLHHQDAMKAADDAWLFKTLVRGLARAHGMTATFMAKPYAQDAGNGMHVHFSVLDESGRNVFDNGGPKGTSCLRAAIAGCLRAMPASTAILAPHRNSYARLIPGSHAPTGAAWAYENRTAAIRVPGGPPPARRIEHRSAGGDVNPYLTLAAMLGAALEGIEADLTPPAPIEGNAYELADLPQLAPDLETALCMLEQDDMMARILPKGLIDNFCATKRQELRRFEEMPQDRHWTVYLETV